MADPSLVFQGQVAGLENSILKQYNAAQRKLRPLDIKVNDKASLPLGQISKSANDIDKSLVAATQRIVTFAAAAAVLQGVRRGFEQLIDSVVKVEESLTRINVNLGQSAEGLNKFSKEVFNIARNTGQTFEATAKAAEELARQGLGAEETLRRLADANVLARIAGVDNAAAVESLTAAINSFSKEALSSSDIINKLVAVDTRFAVSSKDLSEAISRVGSSATEAGVSFDELLAIVTSVQQTTARGGAVIGNAFKTIFTRIQRPEVLEDLEAIGVAVRDLEGNTLPTIQILQNLASTYDTLSSAQKSVVSEQVAGVFQINILKAALSDLNKESSAYSRALGVASGATDEAIRKNEELNKTLASLINATKQSVTEFLSSFANIDVAPLLRTVLTGFNSLLNSISGSSEDAGKTFGEGVLQGISNVLTGPVLITTFAVIGKALGAVAKTVQQDLKALLNIGTASKERAVVQERINILLQQATAAERAQFESAKGTVAQKQAILAIDQRITAEIQKQALAQRALQEALLTGGGGIFGKGRKPIIGAADGFIPNVVAAEKRAVQQGVGGASGSAKPVVIPNFNFGGGKKGTVVANSDEYIVPNYEGGSGTAIFKKDMAKSMGLPSGAKKVGFAGGFVPNFASLLRGASSLGFGAQGSVLKSKSRPDLVFKKFHSESITGEKTDKAIEHEYAISKLAEQSGLPIAKVFGSLGRSKKRGGLFKEFVGGFNTDELDKIGISEKELTDKLAKKYSSFGIRAQDLDGDNVKIQGSPAEYARLVNTIGPDAALDVALSRAKVVDPGVFGFTSERGELGYKKILSSFKAGGYIPNFNGVNRVGAKIASQFGLVKGRKAFNQSSANCNDISCFLAKEYGYALPNTKGALAEFIRDYKSSKIFGGEGNKDLRTKGSLVVREPDVAGGETHVAFKYGNKEYNFGPGSRDGFKVSAEIPLRKIKSAALGYVPNFNDPLVYAIERERKAGVPLNQIYVDKDSRVKGPGNPLGLLVANRRDEPVSGAQGIERVMRQGGNPKYAGAARGFVPNFQDERAFTGGSKLRSRLGTFATKDQLKLLNLAYEQYIKGLNENSPALKKAARDTIKNAGLTDKSYKQVILSFDLEAEAHAKAAKAVKEQEKKTSAAAKTAERKRIKAEEQAAKLSRETAQKQAAQEKANARKALGLIQARQRALLPEIAETPVPEGSGKIRPAPAPSTPQEIANVQAVNRIISKDIKTPSFSPIQQKELGKINATLNKLTSRNFIKGLEARVSGGDVISAREQERIFQKTRGQVLQTREFKQFTPEQVRQTPQLNSLLSQRISEQLDPIFARSEESRRTRVSERVQRFQAERVRGVQQSLGKVSIFGSEARDLRTLAKSGIKLQPKDRELIDNLVKERSAQRQQTRSNRLLGASFLAPFAAGFIEPGAQALGVNTGGGTTGGKVTGGISGAIQGASLGALLGPLGAGIGGVIGGLVGVFGKLKKSAEELSSEFERGQVERNAENEAIVRARIAQEELTRAIQEGAPQDVLRRREEDVQGARRDIRTERGFKLLEETDVDAFNRGLYDKTRADEKLQAVERANLFIQTENIKNLGKTSEDFGRILAKALPESSIQNTDILRLQEIAGSNFKLPQSNVATLGGQFGVVPPNVAALSTGGGAQFKEFDKAASELRATLEEIGITGVEITRENINSLSLGIVRALAQNRSADIKTQEARGNTRQRVPRIRPEAFLGTQFGGEDIFKAIGQTRGPQARFQPKQEREQAFQGALARLEQLQVLGSGGVKGLGNDIQKAIEGSQARLAKEGALETAAQFIKGFQQFGGARLTDERGGFNEQAISGALNSLSKSGDEQTRILAKILQDGLKTTVQNLEALGVKTQGRVGEGAFRAGERVETIAPSARGLPTFDPKNILSKEKSLSDKENARKFLEDSAARGQERSRLAQQLAKEQRGDFITSAPFQVAQKRLAEQQGSLLGELPQLDTTSFEQSAAGLLDASKSLEGIAKQTSDAISEAAQIFANTKLEAENTIRAELIVSPDVLNLVNTEQFNAITQQILTELNNIGSRLSRVEGNPQPPKPPGLGSSSSLTKVLDRNINR